MAGDGSAIRRRALVRGRVQGVGFRAFALYWGQQLDLSGEVRNRPDGSVECTAEGPFERVEQLLSRLRIGPPLALVDSVEVMDLGPGIGDTSFRIG